MKILVTGANGVIGKKICKKLSQNNEVIKLSLNNADYDCDISNIQQVEKIATDLQNIDVLVHCAALINFDNFNQKNIEVNTIGTLNIIKLARTLNCKKIIYLSSIPIAKNDVEYSVKTINDCIEPPSLYHISKLAGEQILNLFNKEVSSCIIRIAAPIDSEMPENRMIPMFLKAAINNEDIFINGKGSRLQTYISTDDISECISLVIDKNITGKYVLDGEVYSNYEIANLCKQITASNSVIHFGNDIISEDNEKWIIDSTFREKILKYELRTKMIDILTKMKERYS